MSQNDRKEKDSGPEDILNLWLKPMMEFWGMTEETPFSFKQPDSSKKGPTSKSADMLHSSGKLFQLMLNLFSKPENLKAVLQGFELLPEFGVSMSRQLWGGYFEIQKQWMDRVSRLGRSTEAYQFEDMDQEIFRIWRDIYEKEFQKILHIPQLGLNRYSQERINQFLDRLNIVQTSLSEFLYMFYVPLEKSAAVMQEKMEQMAEEGKFSDDFNEYYKIWIKTLEGHYMTLLQSNEYKEVLKNTINSVTDFKQAREEMLYDLLKSVPVPTNKEMDELYKDIYKMKKKLRKLEKLTEKYQDRPDEPEKANS